MKSCLLVVTLLVPLAAQAGSPNAGAPPPLAEARGDLDGDGRPERVHLESDGSLRVDDAAGRELGRVALQPGRAGTVAIVTVEDQELAVAKVPLAKGRTAEAVVRLDAGKLETIYAETTGPVGDGERSERLRVDEAGVVRYQTAPTARRCDGQEMLFPERWDFAGRRFRPVEGEVPDGQPIQAVRTAPAGFLAEPLGMFHFSAASTSPDAERKADRLGAPRELEDGKADTLWVAGPANGGRGVWVTARAPSDERRLRALRIQPGPGWPQSLGILAGKQSYRVKLSGPQTVWVVLPESAAASCVSLIVAEPHGKGADTSLAEVALFTDLDVAGGLEQLVETVASERPGAHGAEQVLVRRGAEAAKAIETRLGRSQAGRRRLLGALAELQVPEAAPPLGRALETAGSNERAIVVEGLIKLGAAGAAEALRVYADPAQALSARQDAAKVLGEVGGEASVSALIHGAGDEKLQASTLRALQSALTRDARVSEQVAAALEKDDSCGVQVGVWARLVPGNAAVDKAWTRCKKGDFAVKLRLVRSLKNKGLLAEAAEDGEPVLRAAAVESGGPLLLQDPDPGVRRVSLMRAEAAPAVEALQKDSWPMVRRTAAETLGKHCSTAPLMAAVEKDQAEEVRRESLVSLGRCGPMPMAFLSKVLKSHEQPIGVRELAAVLLSKQGGTGAATLLAETIDDVLGDPAADERSASLAVACLRGLGRLKDGSPRVLEALGAASNEPLSPAVRAASMEAIGQICPQGAGDALKRGQQDPDATVKRAAKQALDKCKR